MDSYTLGTRLSSQKHKAIIIKNKIWGYFLGRLFIPHTGLYGRRLSWDPYQSHHEKQKQKLKSDTITVSKSTIIDLIATKNKRNKKSSKRR